MMVLGFHLGSLLQQWFLLISFKAKEVSDLFIDSSLSYTRNTPSC